MVARDSTGTCNYWSKKSVMGRPKPVDEEALAILHGLSTTAAHGWKAIILESDNLQLTHMLSRSTRTLASFGAIVDVCFEIRQFFQRLCFQFIRRAGNELAHRIATCYVVPLFRRHFPPFGT